MGNKREIYFEDVQEGMELPPVQRQTSEVQLFLYSAITRNTHRIHYDLPQAQREEHPGVLVHGSLHGAMLCSYITDWIGDQGWLKKVAYQNRGRAVPGETLTFKGRVTRKYKENGSNLVELEVWEENEKGVVNVPCNALVILPSRPN